MGIAEKLRGLMRIRGGLKTADLAKGAALSSEAVRKILNGQQQPGRKALRGFATALEVTIDYLDNDRPNDSDDFQQVATAQSFRRYCDDQGLSGDENSRLWLTAEDLTHAPITAREWRMIHEAISPRTAPRRVS